MTRVLISEGGRRFHAAGDCKAVESAQLIWDNDEWIAPSHPWEWVSIVEAMGRGREACTTCFPGLRAAWYRGNSENDYGHVPIPLWWERTVTVCARCEVDHGEPVLWPCTSAIVLGLVPREQVTA